MGWWWKLVVDQLVSKRMLAVAVLLAFADLHASFAAAPKHSSEDCRLFDFQSRQSISMKDFGRLADPTIIRGSAGAISIYEFDGEDHPVRAGWHSLGFALAHTGDLGVTPVGGFLWARYPAHMKGQSNDTSQGSSATVSFDLDQPVRGCKSATFTLSLKQDGGVYADGKLVETVK